MYKRSGRLKGQLALALHGCHAHEGGQIYLSKLCQIHNFFLDLLNVEGVLLCHSVVVTGETMISEGDPIYHLG